MKDDLKDKDKDLQLAHQDVEDKTAILAAVRKSLREYRDKYRVQAPLQKKFKLRCVKCKPV